LFGSTGQTLDVGTTVAPSTLEVAAWNAGAQPAQYVVLVDDGFAAAGPDPYTIGYEVFTCGDDASEPNDTFATSTPQGAATTFTAAGTDFDWHAVTAPPMSVVTYDVHFPPGRGDVALSLMREQAGLLTQVGSSVPTSWGRRVDWYNGSTSPVPIAARIQYTGELGCIDYTVEASAAPFTCPAGVGEPNDSAATASDWVPGPATVSRDDDDDYVRVPVPAGGAVRLTLVPRGGDGAPFLWDGITPSSSSIGEPYFGVGDTWVNGGHADGWVYVRVGMSDGYCVGYELLVDDVTPACDPDPAEPNDHVADATPIDLAAGSVHLTSGDVDHYRVHIEPLERLRVEADTPGGFGTAEVAIMTAGGFILDDDFDLAYTNANDFPLDLFVRVRPYGATRLACTPYQLDAALDACGANDALEPNDEPSQAFDVPTGQELVLGVDDVDVWDLGEVPPSVRVSLGFFEEDVSGTARAQLVDASGTALTGSSSWTNSTGAPVRVFARVYRSSLAGQCADGYRLEVTSSP
jgi:hypothetical protein